MPAFRLHQLNATARLGLTFLLLTIAGGLAASAAHLVLHHQNRDERPGLSMEDIRGAYHGVRTTASLVASLESSHPEELPAEDRERLLAWLRGNQVSDAYDSLDLGDNAPAEIIQRRCLSCHARGAEDGDGIGQRVPLEYWDDVQKLAISRDVEPVATEILVASAHTHALTMGALSIVLVLLAWCSRWSRQLVGGLILLCGLGLFCDLGSWLLARDTGALVPLIAISGAAWMISTALLLVLSLLELWWPVRGDDTGMGPHS